MRRRVASGFFAGGREIRISSLELAKLYSSRAYLKPSTGTGVLEQESGDAARFLKWKRVGGKRNPRLAVDGAQRDYIRRERSQRLDPSLIVARWIVILIVSIRIHPTLATHTKGKSATEVSLQNSCVARAVG